MAWHSYQGARLRALAKRRGGARIKRIVWNWEFRHGQWDHLRSTDGDALYPVLQRWIGQGRLLDLGCGNATTRVELGPEWLTRYVGVDISPVALAQAEAWFSEVSPLEYGSRLVGSPLDSPTLGAELRSETFDVILFRESIYYVPESSIKDVFGGVAPLLGPDGVFLIRIHDRERYAAHVDAIRASTTAVDEHLGTSTKSITIVARP